MSEKEQKIYIFGEFSLDPSKRIFLSCGQPVHLPAKEFDTLLYFVQNGHRILSKEEMMSAIWNDTFVEEGNLAQYVSRLRKILNTNGNNYIQTLPKKGYRFDAEVEIDGAQPAQQKNSRTWKWITILFVVGVGLASVTFFFLRSPQHDLVKKPKPPDPIALTDGKQDDDVVEWTADNHIRFYRRVSPKRFETWIMNLDGSDAHREASPIKDLLTGVWSPDGKKVFFMKEGNGKTTYLANSDGTSEIALPMLVGNSDWAPNGSKFVYETKVGDNTELFLYTLDTRENVNLTHNTSFDADPTFSPDGTKITFVSDRDGDAEIYIMDLNGENVRRLTNHPAFDHFPSITPDGTQLIFLSNRDGENSHLFIRNMNDDLPPFRLTDFNGILGTRSKAISPDGIQMVFSSEINGKDQIFLMNIEPYRSEVVISDVSGDLQAPSVSPDGLKIVYQARLTDHSIEIRVTDTATAATKTIYTSGEEIPQTFVSEPKWSPDGTKIVFGSRSDAKSDIFSINSDGTGLARLTSDPLPDLSPVFSADGKEIFFVRDLYGKTKIFRMESDGKDAKEIMKKEGYETSPAISPDGSTLVFSGDRQDRKSNGLDVFSLNLSDSASEKIIVSRPDHDTMPSFSPDGARIAFVSLGDGNREIYVMNSDGSGLYRLTRNTSDDLAPTFAKDGKSLYFSSNRNGKFAIYKIELPANGP